MKAPALLRRRGSDKWTMIGTGLGVTAAAFCLDAFTKYLVVRTLDLPHRSPVVLLPILRLVWAKNSGLAMSLVVATGGLYRWLLVVFSAAITIVLFWLLSRVTRLLDAVALGCVLGGALGNIFDRVRLGYVSDFIDFHIGSLNFYVFNMADFSISVGVLIFVLDQVFSRRGS